MSTATPASADRSASVARPRGLSLGRVRGIEIRIDPSWLLIFGLIAWSLAAGYFPRVVPGQDAVAYWAAGALAALLFFASVLLHELSHSLVARGFGMEVPSITLFLFGGVSQLRGEPKQPGHEFWIAAVGPLASFAVAALFWGIGRAFEPAGMAGAVVGYLAWINVALGVFNLLPGLPLDGGRILRAAVWRWTGSRSRASRVASVAGKGLALGLIALGALQIASGALIGGVWLVLIGFFARSLADASHRGTLLQEILEETHVEDAMVRDVVAVPPDLPVASMLEDYVVSRGHRAFPVREGERVLGVVSLDSVRRIPAERRAEALVSECMEPVAELPRAETGTPLVDALERMGGHPSERLLVFDAAGRLAGLLTQAAVARFLESRRLLQREPAPA